MQPYKSRFNSSYLPSCILDCNEHFEAMINGDPKEKEDEVPVITSDALDNLKWKPVKDEECTDSESEKENTPED